MTTTEIRKAVDDRQALVCTLYGEVRAEPIQGIIAAACVIRNRVNKPSWWGSSYKEVCLKKWQFSCWWENNSNTRAVYLVAQTLLQGIPASERDEAVLAELDWVAEGIMSGRIRDITKGANHYLTTALLNSGKAPDWAKGKAPDLVLGAHSFFKLT